MELRIYLEDLKEKKRKRKKQNMLLPAGSRATIRRLSVQLVALTTLY